MNASRVVALLVFTVTLVGCAPATSSRLPVRLAAEWPDTGRERPEDRYAAFEAQYRPVGACVKGMRNTRVAVEQCNPVVYPQSVQQGAAWQYVLLGRDYEATGDDGGAARAYWSALTLSAKMVVSRPEKEKLRRAAYVGLESVAQRRSQHAWGELMRFCSSLCAAYLSTGQAKEDDLAFVAEMNRIRANLVQLERANQAASMEMMSGMLGAMNASGAGTLATMAHNTPLAMQYNSQGFVQAMQATGGHNEALAKIAAASERHAGQDKQFIAVVGEDVPEIEAGNSFLADATIFYLSSSTDPRPYLDLVRPFAATKPRFQEALESRECHAAPTLSADCVMAIGRAMRDIEVFVAKYERRGLIPPAEVANATWRK